MPKFKRRKCEEEVVEVDGLETKEVSVQRNRDGSFDVKVVARIYHEEGKSIKHFRENYENEGDLPEPLRKAVVDARIQAEDLFYIDN